MPELTSKLHAQADHYHPYQLLKHFPLFFSQAIIMISPIILAASLTLLILLTR